MNRITKFGWLSVVCGLLGLHGALAQDVAAPAVPADPTPPAAMVEPAAEPAATPVATPAANPAPAPAAEGALELAAEENKELAGVEVTEAGTDNKISITLDNVPLQDVVRMFTRISGANIVSGTNLQGNVTVNLQDVEWEPALKVILDTTGNTLIEKSPGIFTIINKSELGSEPVISETVFLNYATVTNILPVVKSMIVSSNGAATGFPGSNAIIIQETAGRVKSIKDVMAKIDKPRDQVLIETKFVELNDEAIKDVGLNWEVLQGYTMSLTPQYEFGKTRNETHTSGDRRDDVLTRSANERRTLSQVDKRSTVDQDASVNFGNDLASSGSTATFPDGTVVGEDSVGTSRGSLNVRGQNFSDFNAEENKITLIPRREATTTDTRLNDRNSLRTVTDTVLSENSVTRGTTEALTAILSAEQFALTLSALKQNSGVEILSNPKVVVASGETANIHVGRNEPNIVAVPQGDTGDRYAYQLDDAKPFIEIGVKLQVTPTLNTESNITVKISPELSRKLSDKSVGEAGTSYPVTQIRKIDTEFNLESGRTVAIGGLTETTDRETVKKVPLLGDIPIIGTYLFRHTHTEKVQDEVIIFVTVSSARPSNLAQISGIPEEGRLIHRHLAQRAEDLERANQDKKAKDKKPKDAAKTKTFAEQK